MRSRRRQLPVALFILISLSALAAPVSSGAAGTNPHWIGVRLRDGARELFDRRTGDRFVPRGSNLLMKVREGDHVASGLFRPRDWDAKAVDRELGRMQALGYNTVRVFIDLCQVDCISTKGGSIRRAYAANISRFLKIAKSRALVVLLASVDVPDRGYSNRLPCCSPFGGYRNSLWLTKKGLALLREYWTEVVRALKARGAPLEVILAYELQQEQFVLGDVEPLSLDSGTVTTADGNSYDMAVPSDRAAMVESNTRLGASSARSAIRRLDPGALVTMGFFASFPGDDRVVPSQAMMERSSLDLVDLHMYPGVGYDLAAQVSSIGITDAVRKPVMMGEFGAFRFAYPNARIGAWELAHWQADSCAYGFQGWLSWLWAKKDDEVFGAREGGDAIARALSPGERPDPCSGANIPSNVAMLGTATASTSLPGEPPSNAIDGLIETLWNAGADPPQWIQIDLGGVKTVQEIDLVVGQFPEGETHHRLLVAGNDGVFALVKEFERFTAQGDVLRFAPGTPIQVRSIRIETVAGPSWVAWPEIRVYA